MNVEELTIRRLRQQPPHELPGSWDRPSHSTTWFLHDLPRQHDAKLISETRCPGSQYQSGRKLANFPPVVVDVGAGGAGQWL